MCFAFDVLCYAYHEKGKGRTMLNNARLTEQRLQDSQIAKYRQHARLTLVGGGYNLFAEITLRVLDSYDALAKELDSLRKAHADRMLEAEMIHRENQELRAYITDAEIERRQLMEEVQQLKREIAQLKKQKLNLPPSWREDND